MTLLLLAAALGGFLLNLTPCVLPVIPIKIMGLSMSAGNRRRCLMLGGVLSAGVVFFWLAIGAAMAFITSFKTISTLYQNPWFPLGVGIFMFAMGLGNFGLFTVKLPQVVYLFNPKGDTAFGSFLFGILTAVLSTPCTAPFMGAAAAWAAFQPGAVTISTFVAIGVGMALPYLILAANPRWIDKVPRSGPSGELLKQVMGLLMFAVAAFFIGLPVAGWLNTPPDPVGRWYWWVVGAFVLAAGLWLAYRTVQITRRLSRRVVFTGLGIVVAAAGMFVGSVLSSHGPIDWVYYTRARFAEARSRGDVIVMDFTAEWCLNCKALESGVLHRSEIVSILNGGNGIVPMKVDITGDNPDGKAKLREIDWIGIPLLAVFGPGVGYDDPIKMDAYTPDMVKEAIERARGNTTVRTP
jgi:thiol:disulfide interchange protein DsbD